MRFRALTAAFAALSLTACGGSGDWWAWYSTEASGGPRDFTVAPSTPLNFHLSIVDVTGDPAFLLQGMAPGDSVETYTIVLDALSAGLTSTVQIREMSGSRAGRIVFRATVDTVGNAVGSLTADPSNGRGILRLTWDGQDYAAYVTVSVALLINRTAYTNAWVHGQAVHVDPCAADAGPPSITLEPTGAAMWPANHQMVLAAQGIRATDDVDSMPSLSVSVESNEPSDALEPDWTITAQPNGTYDVWLRAERLGTGNGRTYTISATSTDACGNTSTKTRTVAVPKNQGRGR